MLHSDLLARQVALQCLIGPNNYRPINYIEAAQLTRALESDAAALGQVTLASLFEGISSVIDRRYSWAIVKLYYTAFFSIRSFLMINGWSVFYIGKSPFLLNARAGSKVTKVSGNTHSAVFKIFNQNFPSNIILSQEIAGIGPLEWLEEQRNNISYKTAPFTDPVPPPGLLTLANKKRSALTAYIEDKFLIYPFDEDHALVAYPILSLRMLSAALVGSLKGEKIIIDSHFISMLTSSHCYVPSIKAEFLAFEF